MAIVGWHAATRFALPRANPRARVAPARRTFGALDPFTREELWGVLQKLWLERHPTVILVTHDLREAIFLADTVYVISHRPGRVVSNNHIDLPRPRKLKDTYTPAFIELSHKLREQVGVNAES